MGTAWKMAGVAGLLLCACSAALSTPAVAEGPADRDRVWLGVLIDDQSLDGGVLLIAVVPGGPAAEFGLKRGDVLLEADGRSLIRSQDLENVLTHRGPGDQLSLKVLRAGRAHEQQVKLAPRPRKTWTFLPREPTEASLPAPPEPPARPSFEPATLYGFSVTDVTPDLRTYYGAPEEIGVLITEVRPGRAAHRAGLRVGDVLVQLGEQGVRSAADVDDLLPLGTRLNEVVEARLVRDNRWTVARLFVPDETPVTTRSTGRSGDLDALELLEQSIVQEIDRLTTRIRELEERLERLRETNPGP